MIASRLSVPIARWLARPVGASDAAWLARRAVSLALFGLAGLGLAVVVTARE